LISLFANLTSYIVPKIWLGRREPVYCFLSYIHLLGDQLPSVDRVLHIMMAFLARSLRYAHDSCNLYINMLMACLPVCMGVSQALPGQRTHPGPRHPKSDAWDCCLGDFFGGLQHVFVLTLFCRHLSFITCISTSSICRRLWSADLFWL